MKGGKAMLGRQLKKYRFENGMTQADLAKRLAVSQNTVSQYEAGKRTPPVKRIAEIAETLGVPVSDILSDLGA